MPAAGLGHVDEHDGPAPTHRAPQRGATPERTFAHNHGSKTPAMFMVGHVPYGTVLGLLVALLAN